MPADLAQGLPAPRLRRDINLGTLLALPPDSLGWRASLPEQLQMLREDGHEAVQSWGDEAVWAATQAAGLRATGMARVRQPQEADEVARRHQAAGLEFTTLHVGTGFESDAEMDALAHALLNAQARHGHPLWVETHRATATQDIWRTLRWVERFPELRFTADLSHWYSGHELTYGGEFAQRMAHLTPVFERTRALHGRIGNSGCLQTALDEAGDYLAHYRALWTACCLGFLQHAQPGEVLSFNAELLPMRAGDLWLHYAQSRSGHSAARWAGEPTDRYADAAQLWRLAQDCFVQAQAQLTFNRPTR
ncbi:hypothetical protein [Ideonella paludis]|uniref:Sugar phosphate isomerase/epimerase n=1 Tax=Ideonella paludis TaxID=1233411 RepID=A0ABS5E1R9_9BURK|nr:hypothetical protein [Ideonella paludis]MBQ0937333.1 hypothetical protein [Ideonella paludis]